MSIINCSVVNNREYTNRDDEGFDHWSGLFAYGGSNTYIYNSIFWEIMIPPTTRLHSFFKSPTAKVYLHNCIVEGDSSGFQKGDSNDFVWRGTYQNCYSDEAESSMTVPMATGV